MTFIQTYTGKKLDLKNPHPEQIDIIDIAHGLSQICRFAGQSSFFYSVAQHSIYVSRKLKTPKEKLLGLLHDATEAYIGDIPTPVKSLCPDYKAVEGRLWRVIAKKFDIPEKMPKHIKMIDMRVLSTERAEVFANRISWGEYMDNIEPYDRWHFREQSQWEARRIFLAAYEYLFPLCTEV